LALALVPALTPGAVEAQDPPNVVQAREHLNRGTALLDQENYDAALVEFMRAYDLVGEHPARPLILFNIARAHERLFRYDQALEYYARFLQEAAPDAPQRGEVQGTMRALEGLLATVQVTSNVPAQIWVDDREVGASPGSVRIPGGSHVVVLRAQGYQDSRQQIQVAARETRALTFELGELAAEYRGISSVFFWGATGLAAAAALAGGAMGIVALTRRGDVDAQLMDPVLRHDGGSLEAARAEIETYALVADVLFGTAGVFAITAVVLAFLTDWGGAPAEEAPAAAELQLVPVVGPSFTGLSLGGSF
jgi:tetratricopeptide (TPR) repeat protein